MFGIILPLLVAFALVGANGIFVASEFSLVALNRDRIERAAEGGDRGARRVVHALRTLSFQLSGAQLGITMCSLLVGYLAEPVITRVLAPRLAGLPLVGEAGSGAVSAAVAIVVSSGALIVMGEMIPKNAAVSNPEGTAKLVATPQRGFSAAFRPFITVLNESSNRVVRLLGVEPVEELENVRTADELSLLMTGAARAGTVGASTAEMARRSLYFGEQRAAGVMTPRVDVIAVDTSTTVETLLVRARETGFSRFPVYGRGLDDVVGLASVKGALRVPVEKRGTTKVADIAPEPLLVPDSVTADAVLAELLAADTQLAVVVDEYGGTGGIITLEDLVEELVGQVADEYDRPEPAADSTRVWAQGRIIDVSGSVRPNELSASFQVALPDGPYDTLAGFLLDNFGHLPAAGETLDYSHWRFTVLRRTRQRIRLVRIERVSGTDESGEVS